MFTKTFSGRFTQGDGQVCDSEVTLTVLNRTFVGVDRSEYAIWEMAGEVTESGLLVGYYYNKDGVLLGSVTLVEVDEDTYDGYYTGLLDDGKLYSLPYSLKAKELDDSDT